MSIIDIDELRKSITAEYAERIEVLKKELADELATLDRLEERTRILAGKPKTIKAKTRTKDRDRSRKKAAPGGEKKPNAKNRILAARQVLHGEFSRKALRDTVNADGLGEMKNGTFSPTVSNMVGEEIIEAVKAVGNTPAVYMWKEEYEALQAKPSLAGHEAN